MLRGILLVISGVLFLHVWAVPFLGGSIALSGFFAAVLIGTSLLGLRLIDTGRVRPVTVVFSAISWLAVTGGVLVFGGIQNSSSLFYLVHLVLVGLIWSQRAMFSYAAVSSLTVLAISWAETNGRLPEMAPPESPYGAWLGITVALGAAAGLLHVAYGSVHGALQRSRRTERQYARLIHDAAVGIISVHADGRIESVNPAARRILGMPPGSEGTSLFEFHGIGAEASNQLRVAVTTTADGGQVLPFELNTGDCAPDDALFEVELSRHEAEHTTLVQITLQDFTERRRAELERAALEEQLRQSQKLEAIGHLAGGIAHDFNNYLTVIRTNCELALLDCPPDGEAAQSIHFIDQAAERVALSTRKLLTFSRKQFLQPRVLEPDQLLFDVHRMLDRGLGELIQLGVRTGASGRVFADPAQLEAALLNLAVNARDAMPGGGILKFEVADVEISLNHAMGLGLKAGPHVAFRVSDSGPGIEPEMQDRIFEPFFTTKSEHSSGLGLSTVYGIVQQSGGAIRVDSAPGHGATFEILLPVTNAEPEPSLLEQCSDLEPGRGTILVVEDEGRVRGVVSDVLKAHGFGIVVAADGREALDALRKHEEKIDLVLTDVIMPKMGGVELADRLRQEYPGLPIIFMSGYGGDAMSNQGGLDPDIPLLQKPFRASDLLAIVNAPSLAAP